jgi:hypothetical protein
VDNDALRVAATQFSPENTHYHTACGLQLGRRRHRISAAKEFIMTKRFVSVLSAASLVAVLSPLAVSLSAAEVTCQIPFAFAVNGAPLPAGRYTVSTRDNTLLFRGLTRGAIVLGQPTESRVRTTPKLVFDKQGDEYTLRQVWLDGRSGQTFAKSRTGGDRKAAANSAVIEEVIIAAR